MNESIICPKCGEKIDINSAIISKFRSQNDAMMKKRQDEFDREITLKREEYKKHLEDLSQKERNLDDLVAQKAGILLKDEREKIKKELISENASLIDELKKQLNEKSAQISDFNKTRAEFEELKRKNAEMAAEFEAKKQIEINRILTQEREKIEKIQREKISEEFVIKMREKDEKMAKMGSQLDDMKRRLELGSQQAQGEAMELVIEDYLRQNFLLDEIREVKKGINGADCEQIVRNEFLKECGKILYESKRTKSFSADWLDKFKLDMIEAGADVGIIVTQTMPKDMDKMGVIDGVWICSFSEFKGLSGVLRESVIKIFEAKNTNQNRSTKMDMLYNYLTSNEFALQISSVVSVFNNLESELAREQNAMKRIWKARSKQIEMAKNNAIEMFGSLKGIAGNEIATIKSLELEYIADDENENF